MIQSFTITNYLGESVKIGMREPGPSGFLIQSVDGLGPVKATINTTEVSTNDGSLFNSARLQQRNIVFQLLFAETHNADGSVAENIEDIRCKTYKYFPIKKQVNVLIETESRLVETTGYVESNNPDIFSMREGTQISIICQDSYFYSAGANAEVVTVFYGITPMFYFPFSNKSLTEPKLIMGSISKKQENSILYEGDAEVGMTIILHATGEVGDITLLDIESRGYIKISSSKITTLTGSGFNSGDDIIISTSQGEKGALLVRNGVVYNILNALERGSEWFKLSKGDNKFFFDATSGKENVQITIRNKVVYEGV